MRECDLLTLRIWRRTLQSKDGSLDTRQAGKPPGRMWARLGHAEFNHIHFTLFLTSSQALQEVTPGYHSTALLQVGSIPWTLICAFRERPNQIEEYIGTIKVYPAFGGRGGKKEYSLLPTTLGVLTALKDFVPGKRVNWLEQVLVSLFDLL